MSPFQPRTRHTLRPRSPTQPAGRPGSARYRDPAGWDRAFTLVELLVVIAIISIIAGFLVPTLLRGRAEANKIACANSLREIARAGMIFTGSSGKRFFPIGEGRSPAAHESLNVLVKFFGSNRDLNAELFVCPEWRGEEPQVDASGRYVLDEDTCAYTWTSRKLSPTDAGYALSSDKYVKSETQLNGHEKGMNVVYTDTAVKFVLQEALDGENGLPAALVR